MTYSNMWPRGEWVRRHLNWTLILYALLIYPILIPIFILVETTGSEDWFYLMFLELPWIVGVWYLMVWNLKHKGRSLWNLLYLLIPWVGGIVFLCISNKDQMAKENLEREERERYREEYLKRVEAEKQGKGQL